MWAPGLHSWLCCRFWPPSSGDCKTDEAVLEGKVLLTPQPRGPGPESDGALYWAHSCYDIREVSEERGERGGRRGQGGGESSTEEGVTQAKVEER